MKRHVHNRRPRLPCFVMSIVDESTRVSRGRNRLVEDVLSPNNSVENSFLRYFDLRQVTFDVNDKIEFFLGLLSRSVMGNFRVLEKGSVLDSGHSLSAPCKDLIRIA